MKFQSQDLQWTTRAKSRIRRLFAKEPLDRIPFQFTVIPARTLVEDRSISVDPVSAAAGKERFFDHERDLGLQMGELQKRFALGCWDDFVYSLHPYAGVGTVASVFGCRTEFHAKGDPTTLPAVHAVKEIDRLKPDFGEADVLNLALEKMRYFADTVGERVPVSLPDIQSPLDTASLVMDQTELLAAMYEDPGYVHRLLAMVTEAIIMVIRRCLREMRTDWPASQSHWLPYGAWISDDLLTVLSPDLYREFGVKYNSVIAGEFGGVFLHTCGDPQRHMPVLLETENLLGLNFWEIPLSQVQGLVNERIVLNCGYIDDAYWTFAEREKMNTREEIIARSLADLRKIPRLRAKRIWLEAICRDEANIMDTYTEVCRLANLSREASI